MTCDELRPDCALYAMGVLEDPERAELRTHLDGGCERCIAGMKEARELLFALGASTAGAAPPKRLRKRILASVGAQEEQGWHWMTAWRAAGAMAVLAIGAGLLINARHGAETGALQAENRMWKGEAGRSALEAASFRDALRFLESPETRQVTFGAGKAEPPRGKVFVHPTKGVLLVASNLPVPPAGKTYEMWIIPKGGKPAPAGLFTSSQDGTAVHRYNKPISLALTGAVAVTLENAGGVDAPTSQPLIVAAL
ncbi:MAG: anti-sigma factor [Acidobacteria bacterium]|nr:anti-sigma factor [Acidobacteriota bacterium]